MLGVMIFCKLRCGSPLIAPQERGVSQNSMMRIDKIRCDLRCSASLALQHCVALAVRGVPPTLRDSVGREPRRQEEERRKLARQARSIEALRGGDALLQEQPQRRIHEIGTSLGRGFGPGSWRAARSHDGSSPSARRSTFRSVGNNHIQIPTTARVPSPPITTAGVVPNQPAVMPDSNSPSSPEAPMKAYSPTRHARAWDRLLRS